MPFQLWFPEGRPWPFAAAVAAALTAAGAPASRPAAAAELPRNAMGVTGYFDTTVSTGGAMRVSDRDSGLIGTANGGTAHSINGDDGNLNYGKSDLVSANGKVTHELQLDLDNLGFFGRAFYFYDRAVAGGDTDRTRLSDDARKYAGRDVELLDAYVTGDFDAGGIPVSLRVGNQVMSWGESVFIRNGINSINPVDVSKLRVAGAEVARRAGTGPGGQRQDRGSPTTCPWKASTSSAGSTPRSSRRARFSRPTTWRAPAATPPISGSAFPALRTTGTARRTRGVRRSAPACRAPATGMPTTRASSAWRYATSRPS